MRAIGGKRLAPAERTTLSEAVDIPTVHAARAFVHRTWVNLLKPGHLADVIVPDRNPFRIPITDVHATRVLGTWVGGDLSFQAEN